MSKKRIGIVVSPKNKDLALKALKDLGYEGEVELYVSRNHSEDVIGIGDYLKLRQNIKSAKELLEKYMVTGGKTAKIEKETKNEKTICKCTDERERNSSN